ncbi:sensor histidine kinase [Leptospira sarikeiensis]|uniref:histidine kinase n=1 Tax=Leptospira sarikeiensis TaxID=2484943 RepID=A0A4R9K3V0_9LEPT|nr:PAS domain-containing sensor histidine kinase [Leptospira sarikeiensis]TGL60759.1 PAS domain S-box protein [Leptospira sarikeiensis]
MNTQDRSQEIFNNPELLRKLGDFIPCPLGLSHGTPGNGDVIYLNRSFLEQIGYNYEDIPNGERWFEAALPDPVYREEFLREWKGRVLKAKEEGRDFATMTVRIRLKNGQDKWFEIKGSAWENYLLVAFLDIDEVYNQREELQRRSDFKDRVLSVLTHDLRTPLAQVSALAELIATTDIDPSEREMFAKKIVNELKSVGHFINNTAHWASANFGYLNIKKEAFDPKELFLEMSSFYGAIAETKKVNLTVEVSSPTIVISDKEILSIILRNLISNAVKFTPPGKKVIVRAHSEDQKYRFSIQDEGGGIDPDHLRDLKEGRLSSKLGTVREKGLGIGLSICFDMAKRLDAFLDFESEPAIGTRAILLV